MMARNNICFRIWRNIGIFSNNDTAFVIEPFINYIMLIISLYKTINTWCLFFCSLFCCRTWNVGTIFPWRCRFPSITSWRRNVESHFWRFVESWTSTMEICARELSANSEPGILLEDRCRRQWIEYVKKKYRKEHLAIIPYTSH